MIFERLNAGGVNLQPQEVRVALYHGEFVRVLRELNDMDKWRALYGSKSRRLKDMELILRFFAFFYYADEYQSPMKDFLNRYMATNRRLERQSETELKAIFGQTTALLCEAIGQRAFRPRTAVNAAVVDSLMTGVATRLAAPGPIRDKQQFKEQYDRLITHGSLKCGGVSKIVVRSVALYNSNLS